MKQLIFPDANERLSELVFLLFRLLVGTFLIWGVWDNIVSPDRMAEFSAFLDANGFIWPSLLAPVSVYAQFVCGLIFVAGVFTRWGGLLCAVNFVVALIMVDLQGGFRQAFPAAALVFFGLYIAYRGPGPLSLDTYLKTRFNR